MTYYWDWDQNSPLNTGNGSFATDGSHTIFHYILVFYTLVDLPLQGYVAFLILRVATETLKEYRFFMLLCVTWDFCLSVGIGFIMQPRSLQPLSNCIAVQGPAAWFSHTGAIFSFGVAIFFAAAMVLTQDFCLAYRLTLVTSRAANETFMRPTIIASALGSLYLLAVGIAYAASRMFYPHAEEYIPGLVRTEYILDDSVSLVCFDVTPVGLQYTFYAASGIIVLVATFTPLICFLIPITACCFAIINSTLISPVYIYIGILSLATFPKVNALLTITFVAPYRKYTWKRLHISDPMKTSIIEMISSHAWVSRART